MYVLQEPTGYNNLQQIIATPVLLTVTGKLITATMNPMDSQQQYIQQPKTLHSYCQYNQTHAIAATFNNTDIPILMANKTIATRALLGVFFFLKKNEGLINTTATKCL